MTYAIVPVTLIITPAGELTEVECSDEQAIAWGIYAQIHGSERKRFLLAASTKIAAAVVDILEHAHERGHS